MEIHRLKQNSRPTEASLFRADQTCDSRPLKAMRPVAAATTAGRRGIDFGAVYGSVLSFPWWGCSRSMCCVQRSTFDVRRAACSVRRQGNQGRRATASVNVLHAGQSADISPFISLRRSPNALGRRHRFRLRWLEHPARSVDGVALRRAGVSRAGKEGRAGGCPARNDTERGTPARRGAVAQHPRPAALGPKNERQLRAASRPRPQSCTAAAPHRSHATATFRNSSRSGEKLACRGSSAPPSARASGPMVPGSTAGRVTPCQL